jgi:two-component system OmpR family response regulator
MQITRLRRKLGDDPKVPALIRSVRGVGYMLACTVES